VGLAVIGIALGTGGCKNGQDGEPPEAQQPSGGAAEAADGGVVNAVCPIMGTQLDPDKVPGSLTRQWRGKTVGFCCAGCPAAWDKLSDEEKQQKLAAAMAEPAGPEASHAHEGHSGG
jgi:hypothetical protein